MRWLCDEKMLEPAIVAKVPALAKHVRDLAVAAGRATDQDARAKVYGELLSTCAGCHLLIRPNPVRP